MELEVLKAKEERLVKKKIVADVCDDILAWVRSRKIEQKNNAEKEKASQLSKVDVLENVEIGEQKQREEAYKAAKRKAGIYDHDEYFNGLEKKFFPQYDDPVPAEGGLVVKQRRNSNSSCSLKSSIGG
ncbi:hypothetical protein EV1_041722 [Malus domestica]